MTGRIILGKGMYKMDKRVRTNCFYTYNPVMLDQCDPPHGVKSRILKTGDRVRVVNLPGCPKNGTMGMCHIQTMTGAFAGLVCCNSLDK
jgi:hypothetical protein